MMCLQRWAPAVIAILLAGTARPAAAESRMPVLFDPVRHMRVSEVRAGMKGYGLTVFKGTKVDRFDVEVLSVLKNFNPKYDVVLIKCEGEYLQHTGAIAGMSGSPVYLRDDAGRDRMIGAFAYGWPLTKDPVAGVQPIEYMLTLPWAKLADKAGQAAVPAGAPPSAASGSMVWSLKDAGFLAIPGAARRAAPAAVPGNALSLTGDGESMPRLAALATPLMVSGASPALLKQLAPSFNAYGLTPLQAGGMGGSAPVDSPVPPVEPGGVLAVPLLTGDTEMTAIGTVTEVLGDRVFGFGHSFNNEGNIDLPMGSGTINGVIANLQTSFKLGAISRASGTLMADAAVGVAGRIGTVPSSVPVEFTVSYSDGSPTRTYRFAAARHSKFTPLLAGMAFGAAVTSASELPQYNTVDYDLLLEFDGGQKLRVANTAVNTNTGDLFNEIGLPMAAAAENPFQRALVRKITGTIRISPDAQEAAILEVNLPKSKYRPGDVVKAFVTYKPFRAPTAILPVEMELPHDLPQGTYQLVISDAQRYFQDEQQSRPFRFTAEKVEDVFAVLRDVASIRGNAVYLRLVRQADGVAIGRTSMPQLPSSMRQVILGAGRSSTTAFVSSTIKIVPTEMVMSGSAEFAIAVDANAKVSVGAPRPVRTDSPAAPPKAEDPHKKPIPEAPATPKDDARQE